MRSHGSHGSGQGSHFIKNFQPSGLGQRKIIADLARPGPRQFYHWGMLPFSSPLCVEKLYKEIGEERQQIFGIPSAPSGRLRNSPLPIQKESEGQAIRWERACRLGHFVFWALRGRLKLIVKISQETQKQIYLVNQYFTKTLIYFVSIVFHIW